MFPECEVANRRRKVRRVSRRTSLPIRSCSSKTSSPNKLSAWPPVACCNAKTSDKAGGDQESMSADAISRTAWPSEPRTLAGGSTIGAWRKLRNESESEASSDSSSGGASLGAPDGDACIAAAELRSKGPDESSDVLAHVLARERLIVRLSLYRRTPSSSSCNQQTTCVSTLCATVSLPQSICSTSSR